MKKEKNIVIANDLVLTYVSIHNAIKKLEQRQKDLKPKFIEMGMGTYIYKGAKKITNCVTVSEVHKEKIVVTNQEAYNEIQAKIDELKEQQKAYTTTVDDISYRATPTTMPKGLNEMLKNGEI